MNHDCLRLLEVTEDELPELKKGEPEKVAIAWLVRRQTSVRLKWICERLHMGHLSNVGVLCGRIDHSDPRAKEAGVLTNGLRKKSKLITLCLETGVVGQGAGT